jgi:preprotein translocase subunit SecY
MIVDPSEFSRHFESFNDEALKSVDRNALVPEAQVAYDQELVRRGLNAAVVAGAATPLPLVSAPLRFKAVADLFRRLDMGSRLRFTLGLLTLCWIGSLIPIPGLNLKILLESYSGPDGWLQLVSSRGPLPSLSVLSLGIIPYFSAWLLLQLLSIVVPALTFLRKKDEFGCTEISLWTRYFTLALALIASFGIAIGLQPSDIWLSAGAGFVLTTTLSLTAGSILVMWVCEQVTDRGIGNGMWLFLIDRGATRAAPRISRIAVLGLTLTVLVGIDLWTGQRRQHRAAASMKATV